MQLSSESENGLQQTPEATPGEFMYLPLNQIAIEEQIRSAIDTDSAAFKAFLRSIRLHGVLEPILAARRGAEFVLISGERRLKACQMLGLAAIPARILENMEEQEAALTVQLTENLHRENLDPIDEAASYARYFQVRRDDVSLDDLLTIIANIDINPRRVDTESSQAAFALMDIAGKSISSLRRQLSLLKLPEEIQQALRSGAIGVTQGYLLASEIDNPGLTAVFKAIMEKPAGYEELKRRLAQARKQAGGGIPAVKADTVAKYRRSLKSIRVSVQLQKNTLTAAQADQLLTDLRELVALIESLRPQASSKMKLKKAGGKR